MATQSNTIRMLPWEEEDDFVSQPAAAPRTPSKVKSLRPRSLNAEPIETTEESSDAWRAGKRRWWLPATSQGRAGLGLAALLASLIIALGLQIGWAKLIRFPDFHLASADNVATTGLAQVDRAEIVRVFGEDLSRSVFFIPLSQRRHEIESMPWVKQATVMRLLPNRLEVSIVERTPIALMQESGRVVLVDAEGVKLPMSAAAMAKSHFSFPVLEGLANLKSDERKDRLAIYSEFMRELKEQGRVREADDISELDLSNEADIKVSVQGVSRDVLVHLGSDHLAERFDRFEAQIDGWRKQYPNLVSADMRLEEKALLDTGVKPQPPATDGNDKNVANDSASNKPSNSQAAAVAAPKPSVKLASKHPHHKVGGARNGR